MSFFASNNVGCCSFPFLIKIDDKSQQTFVLPDKWANGTQSYAPLWILLLSVVLKKYLPTYLQLYEGWVEANF